jgi:hypothetical protein
MSKKKRFDIFDAILQFSQRENTKPKSQLQPRSVSNPAIFINIKLKTVKIIIVDNVLGLHLPLAQVLTDKHSEIIWSGFYSRFCRYGTSMSTQHS